MVRSARERERGAAADAAPDPPTRARPRGPRGGLRGRGARRSRSSPVAAVVWRARGHAVPWRLAASATAAATALGAALGGARPVPLPRCARLLDAALDRGGAARDRVLSALWFATSADAPLAARGDALLARAALHDALTRARAVAPALVAPARRPRALPALGVATLTLVAVGAWPARAPGAPRRGGVSVVARRARRPGRTRRFRGARRRARRGHRGERGGRGGGRRQPHGARARGARDARRPLERLARTRRRPRAAHGAHGARRGGGGRGRGRARGRAGRGTGARSRRRRRAPSATRSAAPTRRRPERALAALAARAEDGHGARAGIASALGAAAASVGRAATGDDAAGAGDGRRRLNREHEPTGAGGAAESGRAGESARRLERLRRDLEDTAAACRGDAEACGKRLRDSALSPTARDAEAAEARRRLETAVRQTRERLRRGDLEGGASERRFRARRAGWRAR